MTRLLSILAIAIIVVTPQAIHPIHAQTNTAKAAPCAIQVPSGSSVLDSGTVIFPDRSVHKYSQQNCDSSNLPTINGWVDSTSGYDTNGYSYVSSEWNVPNGPSNTNDPLIYLFNSLTGSNGGRFQNSPYIIQPITTWGCYQRNANGQCVVGGTFWWLAAWEVFTCNLCPGYYSSIINISPGDHISGSMTWISSGCNGDGTGGSGYTINASDFTLNQATYMYVCIPTKSNSVNSAVLEVYRVNTCDQFPSSGSETFYSISTTPSVSSWTTQAVGSPSCGYGVNPPLTNIHVHSYPTTDFYTRSHGIAYGVPLPDPWWPPYQSGYEFKVTGGAFDYYTTHQFAPAPQSVREAASGFVPSYAWHSQIYINNVLNAEADVGRDNPVVASFTVALTPTVILTF